MDLMRKGLRGSYTVEASIIVPLFLIMLAVGMKLTLTVYQEIAEEKEQEALEGIWMVDDFYKSEITNQVKETISSEVKDD